MLGEFNARVGSDLNTWIPALGTFVKSQQNQNGVLLTCLCFELDLAITNTYFQQSDNHFKFLTLGPTTDRSDHTLSGTSLPEEGSERYQ